jgi:hypothetical protein
MGRERTKNRTLILAVAAAAVLCALIVALLVFERPRYFLEMLYERPRIEQALHAYFDAEMKGDLDAVYRCLAPSSIYRQDHTYGLRPNHDPQSYPGVERFAQVEVDVILEYADTHQSAECNFCFTFLREGGQWFKG